MPPNHQHRSILCRIVHIVFQEAILRARLSGSSFSSTEAAAARTVTVGVMARWDVDNNSGLVIGYEGTSDPSSYNFDECCVRTAVRSIQFSEKFLATNHGVR